MTIPFPSYWRKLRWLIASWLIEWAFSLMSGEMSREMVRAFHDLAQATARRTK